MNNPTLYALIAVLAASLEAIFLVFARGQDRSWWLGGPLVIIAAILISFPAVHYSWQLGRDGRQVSVTAAFLSPIIPAILCALAFGVTWAAMAAAKRIINLTGRKDRCHYSS